MERLTEKELDIFGDVRYCKCHSNDCDYECDECDIISEGANRLKAYEDAEEQLLKAAGVDLPSMIGEFMHYYNLQKEGRLVELPCKVGDTVYQCMIIGVDEKRKPIYKVFAAKVFKYSLDSYTLCFWTETKDDFKYRNEMPISAFGEFVFLTREEAEATLERME